MIWYGMLATTSYGRRDQADEILVERVPLDEPQAPLLDLDGERVAQERGHPPIELDGRDRGAGREQPAGQEAEPRADLQHPVPRHGVGLAQDALEHVDVGEEVLAQPVARPEARVAERAADVPGVEPEVGGAHRASGSDGRASRSSPARTPASNRRAPAAPIIAPLSVHRPGRGTTSGIPRASASPASRARRAEFAATPPPSTMPRAPTSSAARIVFVVSTSTTESWNPHASSATTGSGRLPSRSSAGSPSSARAWPTIRRAAVLRPEKLRS